MTIAPIVPEAYRLTAEDWVRLADESRIVEIIDGEIFMAPAPAVRHQSVAKQLLVRLFHQVEEPGLGTVFFAPIGLKLKDDVVLEPDLLVVLRHQADRIQELFVEAADVVIEVLSPGTAGRDLGIKRERYEEAGIQEYWVVDPVACTVEVLALVDGRFETRQVCQRNETLSSAVLSDLRIDLCEVWDSV